MASLENRVVNTPTKTNHHSVRRSRRALRGLGALALLAPFISAPTPGNIGGCGGNLASTPVTPHEGNTGVTLEETYFQRGLCSGFCQRLYECGFLCSALTVDGLNCSNPDDAAKAFYLCVHEPVLRSELFGANVCPKSCPGGTLFAYSGSGSAFVYQWDVQVCADATLARTCSIDSNDSRSILSAFTLAPSECANANVCRPQ
jgi:hypothetical protein